jgi:hypothetical protein
MKKFNDNILLVLNISKMTSKNTIEENILNLLQEQLLIENNETSISFIKCLIRNIKNVTKKRKITEDVEEQNILKNIYKSNKYLLLL